MPEKINNLVCNRCSTSVNKVSGDITKWYHHGTKVYCPSCVKIKILQVLTQAIQFLPRMKATVVFHLLGIDTNKMHLSDARYLKDIEDKLHSIKSQQPKKK